MFFPLKSKIKRSTVFSICILTMFFLTLLQYGVNVSREHKIYKHEYYDISDFSQNWLNSENQVVNLESLNINKNHEIGKIYTYHNILPKFDSDMILTFRTGNVGCVISVDGEKIYEFATEKKHIFGNGPGVSKHWVKIPHNLSQKEISLDVSFSYNKKYERIAEMQLGEATAVIKHSLLTSIPGLSCCAILMIFGIIYVVIGVITSRHSDLQNSSLKYLGLISIYVSIWAFTELHIVDMFSTHKQATSCLCYMIITILVNPVLVFSLETLNSKRTLAYYIGFFASFAFFIVVFILNVFRIVDFNQSINYAHIFLFYAAFLMLVSVFQNITSKRPKFEKILIITGFSTVTICGCLDMILSKVIFYPDNSKATKFGMILFVAIFGILSILQIIMQAKKNSELEFISQLAYKDGLTGIANRTSYEEHLEKLEKANTQFCIVMFDINNLKNANDKFGHNQGDILIKGAAKIIDNAFSPFAKVFRIGGDEFAAVIEGNENINKMDFAFNEISFKTNEFNRKKECMANLKIAYGSQISENAENPNSVMEKADEKMYRCKKEMKSREK